MDNRFAAFLDGIRLLASDLPTSTAEDLAQALESAPGGKWSAILGRCQAVVAHPHYRALVSGMVAAWRLDAPDVEPRSVGLALRLATRTEEKVLEGQSAELVWTGPDPEATPLRRTEQALLQVIGHARHELTVVTFVVYRIPLVAAALVEAAERDVRLRLIAESPEASLGKVDYDAMQALGPAVAGRCQVYIWPRSKRPTTPDGHFGSLHAKCALADDTELFISSANLTEYALALNMEMGILVQGGPLPGRVKRHIDRLTHTGVLVAIDQG
ncbi:MAG TPA: DISARM system phospholipase D-like protein DrmC [Chloroflexota bacterium]|nr:DISARM system phospholipase D-like protein DrmC [Chloroflexota bacterium]